MKLNFPVHKTSLPVSFNSDSNLEASTQEKVIHERIRQAKLSFNVFLGLTVISTGVSLVGVALLLSGKVSEGIATTSGGLASKIVIVRSLQLTKDTNDRLDKMAQNLDDEDKD